MKQNKASTSRFVAKRRGKRGINSNFPEIIHVFPILRRLPNVFTIVTVLCKQTIARFLRISTRESCVSAGDFLRFKRGNDVVKSVGAD